MKKTILVMLYEIKTTLRRKSFTIIAFGAPLVLGLVALIVMAINRDAASIAAISPETDDAVEQTVEGYVDEGNLISLLPAGTPPDWMIEYPDETTAQAALAAEEIVAYYIIPADYVESGDITCVRLEYDPISNSAETGLLERVLLTNLLGDDELAADVWRPLDVEMTSLASTGPEADQDNWIVAAFPTLMVLILYMAILIPSGMLVNAIVDEKKNHVIEVLMSSISSQQMITGKILALGLLGLLQTALWVGISWAVASFGGQSLNIPAGFSVSKQLLVWAFVYGLLGYAMYGAQMAGLGALAPDLKDARGASFIILSPIIIVYMFAMGIYEAPDGPFALVMSLFPLTSPVGMIARMTQITVPLWQVVLAAVLQLLTAIFIVRMVARLFHAQHILSGQPFSVQRYFRAFLGRG